MKDARITHPDDGGHPDGLQWLMLGEEAKFAYVLGFVEGLFRGHCFTTWGLPDSESNADYLHATRSFNEHWTRFVSPSGLSEAPKPRKSNAMVLRPAAVRCGIRSS